MTKYRWMYLLILAGLTAPYARAATTEQTNSTRYNVLFIAIDDLNDWVGCLGGNPQAITPNFDRYAREHAMVMNKAYCPSTVCGPTRSALLTGKHATHTGVYGNGQNLKHAPKAKDLVTLPEYFGDHGYHRSAVEKSSTSMATPIRLAESMKGNGRFMSLSKRRGRTAQRYGKKSPRWPVSSQAALHLPGAP